MQLLEIEKELAGPDGEAALKRYDAVLESLGLRVKAALDRGMGAAEFRTCRELSEVVVIARKLLRLQKRRV